MKHFIALALSFLITAVSLLAVPPSTNAIVQYPDSTGTNMVFQVLADGTIKSDAGITSAGAAVLKANSASYTNVIKTADGKTNTITVINGQVTGWTIVP